MKISTKGRYGLRAMLELALNSHGDQMTIYQIATSQNISVGYLEQVFSILRKAGLVQSMKGSQGGYLLAEAPDHIRVGDVLRALEGDMTVAQETGAQPNSLQECLQIHVWDAMSTKLNEVADDITLQDLVDAYHGMNESLMYYI